MLYVETRNLTYVLHHHGRSLWSHNWLFTRQH